MRGFASLPICFALDERKSLVGDQRPRLSKQHSNEPSTANCQAVSPVAFCYDGIKNDRMPPVWMYAHEKRERQRQWQEENVRAEAQEQLWRRSYEQARVQALNAFIEGEGRAAFNHAYTGFQELYRAIHPTTYQRHAIEAALARVEREAFQFPDYNTWILAKQLSEE